MISEKKAWEYTKANKMNLISILPATMIGPGFFRNTPSTKMLDMLLKNRSFQLWLKYWLDRIIMGKNFQRARNEEDREVRRKKILRSASLLFSLKESSLPSVSLIADKAGLAKGTIYLYFSTKEEIYLALMADGFSGWIEQIKAEMQNEKADIQSILETYCSFCIKHPQVIHLAAIAPAILEQNIRESIAYEYKKFLAAEIFLIAELLSGIFKNMDFEKSRKLFFFTYSLTLGLWQHCHPPVIVEKIFKKKEMKILRINFQEELLLSLKALWNGYIDENLVAFKPSNFP